MQLIGSEIATVELLDFAVSGCELEDCALDEVAEDESSKEDSGDDSEETGDCSDDEM